MQSLTLCKQFKSVLDRKGIPDSEFMQMLYVDKYFCMCDTEKINLDRKSISALNF